MNFKTWLETTDSSTASYVGGGAPDLQFAVDKPVLTQDPSQPWQMNMFRNWYNSSRGSWAEVQQAALSNPAIKQLIQRTAQDLVNEPQPTMSQNPYDLPPADERVGNVTSKAAEELTNLVRQQIPTHGMKNEPQQFSQSTGRATGNASNMAPSSTADSIKALWASQDGLKQRIDQIDQRLRVKR